MTNSLRLLPLAFALFLTFGIFAQQSPVFSDNERPAFENTYLIDNIANNSITGDMTLRINRRAPFDCKSKVDCPPSIIIANPSGDVNMPVAVNVASLHVGKNPVIGSDGRWIGESSGLKGDSCAISGSDIVCGASRIPLSTLKGADGKSGESCTIAGTDIVCGQSRIPISSLKGEKGDGCTIAADPSAGTVIKCGTAVTPLSSLKGESCTLGASIYPACADGIVSQNIFKMFYSEILNQDCRFFSIGFQKKFASACPASHPNVVGGSCELRTITDRIALTSSEPLTTGRGWQCEMVTPDADLCAAAGMRVWTTCSRAGVDYSAIP